MISRYNWFRRHYCKITFDKKKKRKEKEKEKKRKEKPQEAHKPVLELKAAARETVEGHGYLILQPTEHSLPKPQLYWDGHL